MLEDLSKSSTSLKALEVSPSGYTLLQDKHLDICWIAQFEEQNINSLFTQERCVLYCDLRHFLQQVWEGIPDCAHLFTFYYPQLRNH